MPSRAASNRFWPDDIRLAISISMQFEAGGQPAKGTDSPFPKVDFPDSVPSDPAVNSWFAYGYREGIPRMLDLWDRHGVKVTSHMIGEAVQRHPQLAKEIVERGHEAAGHGPRWSSQYAMSARKSGNSLSAAPKWLKRRPGSVLSATTAIGCGAARTRCRCYRSSATSIKLMISAGTNRLSRRSTARTLSSSPTRCGITIFC